MKGQSTGVATRGETSPAAAVGPVSPGRGEKTRSLVHVSDPFRPVQARSTHPITITELLTDETIENVRRTAHRVQSEWYRHGGRDFTEWKGYSLGKMVAGALLRNQLHGALSNYLACCELLRRRPETTHIEIRRDPGIAPEIWQKECDRRGVDSRLFVEAAKTLAPQMVRQRTMRQRLTIGLNRFLSRISVRRPRQTSLRPLGMLVCGGLTNRHAGFCAALDASSSMDVVHNRDVLSGKQRRKINHQTLTAAAQHFDGLWHDLRQELQRCEWLREVTLGGHHHVISILHDTFLRHLPTVAAEVETARTTMVACRPTLLIAEAQPGNDDYVWSSVADSLGIPVVSVTYELPALPRSAYSFPPASDHVLLMSPLSRSWWLAKGFSEDALLTARSPYLDTPKRERRSRCKFVVLCALKRYSPDMMEVPITHPRRFLQTIMGIARTRRDMEFIVKFHPSTVRLEGKASFASQLAFVTEHSLPNVSVAPLDSKLSTYLERADCVVCPSSSFTILEALAQGIPCILTPPRSAILRQCPMFRQMKRLCRETDLENLGREIDGVSHDRDEIAANWFEGVLYSEPAPSDVIEQLALKLKRGGSHSAESRSEIYQ